MKNKAELGDLERQLEKAEAAYEEAGRYLDDADDAISSYKERIEELEGLLRDIQGCIAQEHEALEDRIREALS